MPFKIRPMPSKTTASVFNNLIIILVSVLSMTIASSSIFPPSKTGRQLKLLRRFEISKKTCSGSIGDEQDIPGMCMFNFQCHQKGGEVIGSCIDGFLFGACCRLSPDILESILSLKSQTESPVSLLNNLQTRFISRTPSQKKPIAMNKLSVQSNTFDSSQTNLVPGSSLMLKSKVKETIPLGIVKEMLDSDETHGNKFDSIQTIIKNVSKVMMEESGTILTTPSSNNLISSTIINKLINDLLSKNITEEKRTNFSSTQGSSTTVEKLGTSKEKLTTVKLRNESNKQANKSTNIWKVTKSPVKTYKPLKSKENPNLIKDDVKHSNKATKRKTPQNVSSTSLNIKKNKTKIPFKSSLSRKPTKNIDAIKTPVKNLTSSVKNSSKKPIKTTSENAYKNKGNFPISSGTNMSENDHKSSNVTPMAVVTTSKPDKTIRTTLKATQDLIKVAPTTQPSKTTTRISKTTPSSSKTNTERSKTTIYSSKSTFTDQVSIKTSTRLPDDPMATWTTPNPYRKTSSRTKSPLASSTPIISPVQSTRNASFGDNTTPFEFKTELPGEDESTTTSIDETAITEKENETESTTESLLFWTTRNPMPSPLSQIKNTSKDSYLIIQNGTISQKPMPSKNNGNIQSVPNFKPPSVIYETVLQQIAANLLKNDDLKKDSKMKPSSFPLLSLSYDVFNNNTVPVLNPSDDTEDFVKIVTLHNSTHAHPTRIAVKENDLKHNDNSSHFGEDAVLSASFNKIGSQLQNKTATNVKLPMKPTKQKPPLDMDLLMQLLNLTSYIPEAGIFIPPHLLTTTSTTTKPTQMKLKPTKNSTIKTTPATTTIHNKPTKAITSSITSENKTKMPTNSLTSSKNQTMQETTSNPGTKNGQNEKQHDNRNDTKTIPPFTTEVTTSLPGENDFTTEMNDETTILPNNVVRTTSDNTTSESLKSATSPSTTSTTKTTSTTTTISTTTKKKWDWRRTCGVRPLVREGRIVNGKRSDFGEWPWQALIRESTWLGIFTKNKCGGVILNEKYVLTAAHCQPGFLASLIVVLGELDVSGEYEPKRTVKRKVKRVVVHRDFVARTFDNDLALLELETPVEFDEHILPICLPEDDSESFVGKIGFVSGWGRLSYQGTIPNLLHNVEVPVIPNEQCQKWFKDSGHSKQIKPEFICAGYKNGKKDSCEGDSGGPLSMPGPDGRWVLAGIVSHGIKCAFPKLPGVYMRMTYYKPWINNVINS